MGHRPVLLLAGLLLVVACAGDGGSGSTSTGPGETTVIEITTTTSLATTTRNPLQPSRVEVNSLEILYNCRGSGSPTVVIAHGGGGPSSLELHWGFGPTLNSIAAVTTVCIYGRPGTYRSEARPGPQTIQTQADDLLSFIDAIGIEEPPIVLGYSWGGLIAQLAAYQHPDEIAGLLLLDSSHWQMFERIGQTPPPPLAPEFVDIAASNLEASVVDDLGALPIYVLTAADPLPFAPDAERFHPIHLELQRDLATLSTNSQHNILEGTHHGTIPRQADDIAAAVSDLVEQINSST